MDDVIKLVDAERFDIRGRNMVLAVDQRKHDNRVFCVGDHVEFEGDIYIVIVIDFSRNMFNGEVDPRVGLEVRRL